MWSWPCLNYDSLRTAMTVENINPTLVLSSFFLWEYLCADYSIRFDSMTFNVKSKSLYLQYIICKHIERGKKQVEKIKYHASNHHTYGEHTRKQRYQFSPHFPQLEVQKSFDFPKLDLTLIIRTHTAFQRCASHPESGEIDGSTAGCVQLAVVDACVQQAFRDQAASLLSLWFSSHKKLSGWHWVNDMENWRQKCVPRVTQHNLFRLFVITIALQFLSQVYLAGWLDVLLVGFEHHRRTSDKRR